MRLRHPPVAPTLRRLSARATLQAASILLVCWTLGPTVANAWTRAQIRGAEAHVELLDGSAAQVALAVRVQITGGWLSELELPGLPQDIAPDPDKPPTMVSESGEKYAPSLTLHRGIWRVAFTDKRSAPWRGDYRLLLVYRQALATEPLNAEHRRVRWSMPAWRFGIEDARIWISAPGSSVSADRAEPNAFGNQTVARVPGRTLFSHHRAQLPRDTEWPVAVDIPNNPGDVVAAGPVHAAPHTRASLKDEWLPQALWLPAWLLLLAWTKQHLTRRLIERRNCTARALVSNLGTGSRTGLAALFAVLVSTLWTHHPALATLPLLAIVLLNMDRGFERAATSEVRWSVASESQLRPRWVTRARRSLRPHAWLDLTMPIGAATLLCAYLVMAAIATRDPRQTLALSLLALAMVPIWASSTRLHFPWDGAKTARAIKRWQVQHQARLTAAHVQAVETVVSVDPQGNVHDARLPLHFADTPTGLSTAELTLVTDARSLRRRTVLLAHTVERSPADLALRNLLTMTRVIDRRSIHMVAPEHITAAIDALSTLGRSAPAEPASEPDRAAA